MLTTTELADRTGRHPDWLRRVASRLEELGLCAKFGRDWAWDEEAVEYLNTLPETRGRKKRES